ncbi:MAG: alginate lyase family protein [Candidatus Krumholzibacteriota bacterium]|nr:alginate lyase family protein [Candidatus Krumholzibacteriota bacterium]
MQIIREWIEKNPASLDNDGWEPYPIALRIVNWVFFFVRNDIAPDKGIKNSLYLQGKWLYKQREIHLLANHFLKDIVALLFWGYCFSDQKIFNWALKNLDNQLEEQFTSEGLHYEYSPTYHALAVNDIMNCYNLLENNSICESKGINKKLIRIAGKGLGAAEYLNSGRYIPVGDVNYQDCPDLNKLRRYAEKLNIEYSSSSPDVFPSLQTGNLKIMMINSPFSPPYNPAHSHADKLSVRLWDKDVPILTDTGNYSYKISDERCYSRSVEAHNTIQVDNLGQAELWEAFRVGYRGEVEKKDADSNKISSLFRHKKYKHYRIIESAENKITINDKIIAAKGLHSFKQYFHVHPGCDIERKNDRIIINGSVVLTFSGSFDLIKTEYYPEMYKKEFQDTVIVRGKFKDRINITTEITI